MLRSFLCVLISVLLLLSMTACITESEKQEIQKMIDESNSKPSVSSVKSSNSDFGSESTSGDISESQKESSASTAAQESGSTQIDNKPPVTENQKDGITIHITQSELDELSKAAKEFSDAASSWAADMPSIIDGGEYDSNRPDWEYSTPDYWKEPYEGGSNPDKYSWEDDANIPNYNFDVPIPPFTGQGEGDTGYSGGTLPDFTK